MLRWRWDTLTHQLFGYLRGAFPGYAHFEDVTHDGSGLLVYDPVVFILRVLQVTIRRIRTERLSGIALGPEYSFHLLAGVLSVEFIENVDERGHIIINLILAVHTVVDGDEADIVGREHHLRVHADLKVIPAEAAHILDDDDSNLVFIDQAGKPLPIRSGEIRPAVTIVHEVHGIREIVVISVLFEDGLLIHNGVTLPLKVIVTREPAVQGSDFASCDRRRRSI